MLQIWKYLSFKTLSSDRVYDQVILLKWNTIATNDDFIKNFLASSYEGEFYTFGQYISNENAIRYSRPNEIFCITVSLDEQMDMHFRDIYNVFDLLGDLGGVTEVLILMFYLFITPLSEHSFMIKALSKLYLARTTDRDLFVKPPFEKA